MTSSRGFLLGVVAWLALPAVLAAQPSPLGLSLPTLNVPSSGNVIVPVYLTTEEPLTVLGFDLVYSPPADLCSALANPGAIEVRKAGRTVVAPEEDPRLCEAGKLRVVMFELFGATVIPPGTGPIVEVVFGAATSTASARIQLSIANVEGNYGPIPAIIPNLTDPPSTLTIGTIPTTTTTTLPPAEIRCCIAGTCSVQTPDACASAGGSDLGPGSCDPDPCARAPEPPPVIPPGCPVAATDASVTCRLADLVAMVNDAGAPAKLLAPLQQAGSRLTRGAQLQSAGQKKKTRKFLRKAALALNVFRKRLKSKQGTRLVEAAARAEMLALVEPLRVDVQALAAAAQ
jgi:hypothetical protein